MDVLRTAANPWGQNVLIGIAWDLVWLAVWASLAFVVLHAVWMKVRRVRDEEPVPSVAPPGLGERVTRHSMVSRAFHWSMALAMLVLLATAFVPVLGLEFAWVQLHWIAGLVLLGAVLYHIVHALGWQDWRAMWMSAAETPEGLRELRNAMGGGGAPQKGGKYPWDHKLYHNVVVLVTVAAVATGLLMMVRIDTPILSPNPYLLGDAAWGVVYVVHGLSGIGLIGLVTAHVYFAIRPEKRWITWSMVRGWITREQYLAHHDPARWIVTEDRSERQMPGGAMADAAARAPREDA
jgi:cytochrome b subunit of formate dehydrogenase